MSLNAKSLMMVISILSYNLFSLLHAAPNHLSSLATMQISNGSSTNLF
jgi:hypothetical protein